MPSCCAVACRRSTTTSNILRCETARLVSSPIAEPRPRASNRTRLDALAGRERRRRSVGCMARAGRPSLGSRATNLSAESSCEAWDRAPVLCSTAVRWGEGSATAPKGNLARVCLVLDIAVRRRHGRLVRRPEAQRRQAVHVVPAVLVLACLPALRWNGREARSGQGGGRRWREGWRG